MAEAITARTEDYSQWYRDIVQNAKLADYSPVRGCMIIRPNGYALWNNMQNALDGMFKDTGHENAYFPLFIPQSFLEREAEHVEGFAKECALVTHYRLEEGPDGNLRPDPESELEEPLVVRPTSETIMWDAYRDWIQSYRDLPILINQWANVVRWEMRTRLFLRTTEFLWQEGHTAHATKEEAVEEAETMLDVYTTFAEEYMAMPVFQGTKSESERFPGAVETYCIEALMQDNKALQAGTSHFLGQNFAKAFDVQFQNENNEQEYVWATSWGVSTRLVGALIMTHSDDHGLVVPPKLAPTQVVIIPILKGDEQQAVMEEATAMKEKLEDRGLSVTLDDDRNQSLGWKFSEYEVRGVPVRLAIGPRDLADDSVEMARRDTLEKESVPLEGIGRRVEKILDAIQENLYDQALRRREENTHRVDDYDAFREVMEEEGGFVLAHWDGTAETEARIQEETGATIRCIPFEAEESGEDMLTGKPSEQRVVFAQAY